jgi:hypothetical protein
VVALLLVTATSAFAKVVTFTQTSHGVNLCRAWQRDAVKLLRLLWPIYSIYFTLSTPRVPPDIRKWVISPPVEEWKFWEDISKPLRNGLR